MLFLVRDGAHLISVSMLCLDKEGNGTILRRYLRPMGVKRTCYRFSGRSTSGKIQVNRATLFQSGTGFDMSPISEGTRATSQL
jgi:hypothetical protein